MKAIIRVIQKVDKKQCKKVCEEEFKCCPLLTESDADRMFKIPCEVIPTLEYCDFEESFLTILRTRSYMRRFFNFEHLKAGFKLIHTRSDRHESSID